MYVDAVFFFSEFGHEFLGVPILVAPILVALSATRTEPGQNPDIMGLKKCHPHGFFLLC